MIRFEKLETKKWKMFRDENLIMELDLITSSVTNKFFIVAEYIQSISETIGEDFDNWIEGLMSRIKGMTETRYMILSSNVEQLKGFVDQYTEMKAIDYSAFVDETKAKKSSILFDADEIEKVMKLSGYLKIYSLISNTTLKMDMRRHKQLYNSLASECLNSDIINKIFNVIRTKTFRYHLTDRHMWDYIRMVQCKSIDTHIIEIFNFIMNSIIILAQEDRNPLTYFVSVVDESVNWVLRSVYKSTVVYDDSVATENIHGPHVNNLKSYAFNDTLGRLKGISYTKIHEDIERSSASKMVLDADKMVTEFQKRVAGIEFISPLSECLVYPILSEITAIPYGHFITLSAEHTAVLSVYLHKLLKEVFPGKYSDMFGLLDYYPKNQSAVATTYKMKAVNDFINLNDEIDSFFGFKAKYLSSKIISFFVGKISRIDFHNILNGEKLAGIPLGRVERDMIDFYSYLFAKRLTKEIKTMKEMVYSDF